ncbi:MAG: hypothetical protein JNL11_15565 [Bdellovibrionaceae bacterium]|nr:hypothetical protein [Pseudobdellovibrionaceae bacterium]
MWRFLTLGLSAFGLAMILISCGENKATNTTVNPYVNNNGCPTGTYYSNGFCYNQNGTQWNGYQNGYTSSINFVSDNFTYRDFKVSNSGVYKEFIRKAMQTCDQANSSGGIYSCDSWIAGQFQMNLQVVSTQSTNVRVTFAAYPQTNSYYWYGYSLPSAKDFFYGMFGFPVYQASYVVKNPLPLDMVVSVVNDSKGFEARAYGDVATQANRSLIQLQVLEGKLEQSAFNYQLAFEGKVFATGRLQRY